MHVSVERRGHASSGGGALQPHQFGSRGMGLAPSVCSGAFLEQLSVNFLAVIEILGERGMNFGERQVGIVANNFVR